MFSIARACILYINVKYVVLFAWDVPLSSFPLHRKMNAVKLARKCRRIYPVSLRIYQNDYAPAIFMAARSRELFIFETLDRYRGDVHITGESRYGISRIKESMTLRNTCNTHRKRADCPISRFPFFSRDKFFPRRARNKSLITSEVGPCEGAWNKYSQPHTLP